MTDQDLGLHILSKVAVRDGIQATPLTEGIPIRMELDRGAADSLLPASLYSQSLPQVPLEKTSILLKTYTGEKIVPKV